MVRVTKNLTAQAPFALQTHGHASRTAYCWALLAASHVNPILPIGHGAFETADKIRCADSAPIFFSHGIYFLHNCDVDMYVGLGDARSRLRLLLPCIEQPFCR